MKKYITEFIGTFFLVLTIGLTGNPLAIGAVLMVMVFAGGHISGGHYNPAVSTGIFVRGRMTANDLGAYVLVQIVAAILAGLVVRVVGGHEAHAHFAGAGRMLLAEFLFT